MAIVTRDKLMVLLGNDLDSFTDFRMGVSVQAKRFDKQVSETFNFDLDSPMVRSRLAQLVTAGIITQATVDRIQAENATLNAGSLETAIPTAVHELYAIGSGFGYKVKTALGGEVIVLQPHLPASAGTDPMTAEQAELIGWLVAEKIRRGMNKSVSLSQQVAAITKTKTLQQIIDEEVNGI